MKDKMKQYRVDKKWRKAGIIGFRPIYLSKDDNGRVLTYLTTTEGGIRIERNTLAEAKIMAAIMREI